MHGGGCKPAVRFCNLFETPTTFTRVIYAVLQGTRGMIGECNHLAARSKRGLTTRRPIRQLRALAKGSGEGKSTGKTTVGCLGRQGQPSEEADRVPGPLADLPDVALASSIAQVHVNSIVQPLVPTADLFVAVFGGHSQTDTPKLLNS